MPIAGIRGANAALIVALAEPAACCCSIVAVPTIIGIGYREVHEHGPRFIRSELQNLPALGIIADKQMLHQLEAVSWADVNGSSAGA